MSDIHGALRPIEEAAPLVSAADWVVVSGDITRSRTRAEAPEISSCIGKENSFPEGGCHFAFLCDHSPRIRGGGNSPGRE